MITLISPISYVDIYRWTTADIVAVKYNKVKEIKVERLFKSVLQFLLDFRCDFLILVEVKQSIIY